MTRKKRYRAEFKREALRRANVHELSVAETHASDPVREAVDAIDPDSMPPREALDALYKLKDL